VLRLTRFSPKLLGFLAIVILLLALINFTGEHRSRYTFIENLVLTAISPVQGFISELGSSASDFLQGVTGYREILEENRELREVLAARDTYRQELLELQKENFRLREMLGFQERTEYELLPAEVIARDPTHWFETITINRGYYHGIEEKMAVVTAEGLVGNVFQVSRNTSKVLLLTDSRRAVSILVQRSRDPGTAGIVEGYPEEEGYLRVINLPPEANIQSGDTIISSGMGGVFPKGLIVGEVMEVGKDQYGLLQQALVRPAVNFNRLEEVFIVLDIRQEEENIEGNFSMEGQREGRESLL